jgi:hypothetical protein
VLPSVLLPPQHLQPPTQPQLRTAQAHIYGGQALPLWKFAPFEPVTDQLKEYGVIFKGAIAITPSNPSFAEHPTQRCIMPKGNQRQLRLTLQRRFKAVVLCLQGYREFRVDVLDGSGYSIAAAVQSPPRSGKAPVEPMHLQSPSFSGKAPMGQIRVDATLAQDLIVFSSGPFLLKGIYLSVEQV